jgi:hypothetical protein
LRRGEAATGSRKFPLVRRAIRNAKLAIGAPARKRFCV